MFPPEAAAAEAVPLVKRVARWLDWWCTPRWRALLTWVGMAAVMGWFVPYTKIDERMGNGIRWAFSQLENTIGVQLPWTLPVMVVWANLSVLWFWVEPFALRLTLRRGMAWLALRIATAGMFSFFTVEVEVTALIAITALSTLVLRGWRSRPWMAFFATALAYYVGATMSAGSWVAPYLLGIAELPYAAVLLYGTRLLRAKER